MNRWRPGRSLTEEECWHALCERGIHLKDCVERELGSFCIELQLFLADHPYKAEYYETSKQHLKRMKTRLVKYSRFLYSSMQLALKEYQWKNPDISSVHNKNREHYYQILLETRKILRYLESKEAQNDKYFLHVSKGPEKLPQIFRSSPEQEVENQIINLKYKLKDLYQLDYRIWEMLRIEKELAQYEAGDPESQISFNVTMTENFSLWLPYVILQNDRTPYHLLLKWMAGIMNSSKQLAERYLVGSNHLSIKQEFGYINETEWEKFVDLGQLWRIYEAEDRLEESMRYKNGQYLFQKLIEMIQAEGLEDTLLTYVPPEPASLAELEQGPPFPDDEEETYEEWCARNELYLSLVPAFLSSDPGTDDINVSFLAGERNEYFAFLYQLMRQEFVITRRFFYETSIGFANSLTENKKIYVERVKQCYLQSYGLFDRVATFIKDYYDLKLPKKVTYHGIWHEQDDPKYENTRERLKQSMNQNPFLQTLYSLSRDIFYEQETTQLEEEYSELARIRNLIAHSFINIIVDDEVPAQFHKKVMTITIEDLMKKTEALLTRVRDVLVYLVLFLLAEEKAAGEQQN